jgi:predicted SprT family Zn-dependent metalloprotease
MNLAAYAEVEARLRARVTEVDNQARKLFPGYASAPIPSVDFRYVGSAAGTANYTHWRVTLNAGQAIQTDAIERLTVPHEIAHLVDKYVYKKSGHGRYWKMICRMLGGDAKRCYNAGERGVTVIRGRSRTEYLYKMSCGRETWIGPVHHNRLQKKGAAGYKLRNSKTGSTIHHTGYLNQSRVIA